MSSFKASLHADRLSVQLRADSPVLGFNSDSEDPLHFPSPDYSRLLPLERELQPTNDKVLYFLIFTISCLSFPLQSLTLSSQILLLHDAITILVLFLLLLSLVSTSALLRSPFVVSILPVNPNTLYPPYHNNLPLLHPIPSAMLYTSTLISWVLVSVLSSAPLLHQLHHPHVFQKVSQKIQ